VVITLWGSDKLVVKIPIVSKLIIRVLNMADAIICEDNNLKSLLISQGLDSKKITLLRNGIDLQSFQSDDPMETKKS
jgi:hypothetical protein